MRRPLRLVAWFRVLLLLSMALSVGGPAAPAFARSLAGSGSNPPATVNTTQPAGVAPSGASKGIPTGTAVEVPSRRTQTSQTFRVGTHYETRIYRGSVNYQDAKGAWQPISDTLVADSTSGYAYTNQANRYQLHLPKALGSAPVRVGSGNSWVQFALVGATGSASVKANSASYASALPGVSVNYTAGNDVVKEAVVLQSAAAPHSFVYTLQTSGLTAKADGHGGISFLDSAGKAQFSFAAPYMKDSSGKPSGVSRAVSLTLGTNATGQTVTLAADPTWLASQARVYPVTIDPTVYINSITFTGATADCYLVNGAYVNSSQCGQDTMYAGYDGSNLYRTLLNFNIEGGYGKAFPSTFTILEASVNLLLTAQDIPSSAPAMALQQVTQPWTTAADWNTTDGTTAWTTPGGAYTANPVWTTNVGTAAGVFYQWYVTNLVQGWSNGQITNDGLLLKEANESTVNWVGFDSSEDVTSAHWPYLNIKWEQNLGVKGYSTINGYGLTDRSGLGVNVANGNLLLQTSDLAIAGTGLPLAVNRSYNNLSVSSWDVGNSWALNTGSDIELVPNGNGNGDGADLYGANWGVFFPRNPDGSFSSPTGIDATLVHNQDGSYTLTFQGSGGQYHFPSGGGLMLSQNDKNGNQISYGYNSAGNMVSLTDTQGRVTSFAHNSSYSSGLITTMTDPSGRTYQYGYDSNKNLTSYTDPNNKVTQYGYDSSNELIQITDPNGNVTKLTYDGANTYRVTSVTLAAGSPAQAVYSYTYNTGNTVVTDPNGHQTTYYYDYLGRVTKAVDAAGNSFQTAWTADSHPATSTDALGHVTSYGYDANNDLTSVQLPTGATTKAVYGTVSNIPYFYVPTSTTDAQGNTVSYGYDGNGNVTAVTDALSSQNQTQLFYNANGTVNHVVDARGNTTGYGYDGKGNLTSITAPSPLGGTTIGVDGISRVTSVTDGKGQQRTYTYDPLDRVTALSYPAYAAGNVSYSYDADGNILSMADSTGTTTYNIDARNRQTQKMLPGGGTIGYGYNAAGNLTSFSDSASVPGTTLVVTYGYNALNLVTSLAENGKTTTFGYDANHQRTSTTYPDNVVLSQSYDASGRLASIAGTNGSTTLTSFRYSYTKSGGGDTLLPYGVTETLTSPNNTTVTNATVANSYDPLNRLSKWLVTNSATNATIHAYTYQYDGVGNRTQIIADPQNSSGQIVSDPSIGVPHSNESDLSFNAPSEISQIQPYSSQGQALTPVAYSYDAAGNQTGNDGGGTGKPLTISYLPTNQTQSITNTSQVPVQMTWTGPGQSERTKRTWTVSGTTYTSTYTWSALGLSGYTSNGINVPTAPSSVTSWIVRDPSGTPIAQRYANGQEYYFLFDGQGDVVALEDPGTIQGTFDPCPTGNEAGMFGPLTTVALSEPLRQASQVQDDDNQTTFSTNGVLTTNSSGASTQRNCDNPFDPLMCIAPTPFCPFGSCMVIPGILKNFCLFFCPDEPGGGGVASEAPAVQITFGHGARHAIEAGLSPEDVQGAIAADIEGRAAAGSLPALGFFKQYVTVGGQTFEYHGYVLPNGVINVGTYFVP